MWTPSSGIVVPNLQVSTRTGQLQVRVRCAAVMRVTAAHRLGIYTGSMRIAVGLGRRSLLRAGLAMAGLGLLSGCGVISVPSRGSTRVRRIGILSPGPRDDVATMMIAPLLDGLRDLGYAEGRDVAIEDRLSDRGDEFPDLAAELVSVGVDVIVTRGSAAFAAKQATATIPIVAAALGDPLGSGLVTSLQRPEGNVTGLSTLSTGIVAKRLQLLKEIAPSTTRVGVPMNPDGRTAAPTLAELDAAAQPLNIRVQVLGVRTPDDLAGAFATAIGGQVDALLVPSGALTLNYRSHVVALAAHHRLPAFYEHREFADIGGLVSYGPNLPALYRRAASYVDKIFKGAKPADLPIEQPVTFDFIVNVATARTLGLTIPQPVLLQATEIIE
jgi:putative ABC transport system substrate-binding protein